MKSTPLPLRNSMRTCPNTHDNTDDENSHQMFLNAFLKSVGAPPVDLKAPTIGLLGFDNGPHLDSWIGRGAGC